MFSLSLLLVSNYVNCPTVICLPNIVLFSWRDTSSEAMSAGPYFYIVYNLIYLLFIIINPLITFYYSLYFIIQLTALFSSRPERLTTFPPLGAKYLVSVCRSTSVEG